MLYVILHTLWFHESFKLIFPKSSSWLKTMYTEHWRKLAWATFLGNFPILLVQWFCGALMNSCLLGYVTVFPAILAFYFDLVPPFHFLKWNRFFSTVLPVLNKSRHYFNHGKCVLIYKLKRFLLVKLWYTIRMYGRSELQNNNIKKHPSHIYCFWNCLSRNLFLIRLIIIILL